ncbi:MAG: PTS sugar transporter subunit IIB [Candidatus Limnocylindria bacterium]
MATKRIIVACGSGVASSTMVMSRLRDLCRQRHLDVEFEVVDFRSLPSHLARADIFVSIAPHGDNPGAHGKPMLNGVPFLTGIGMEPVMDELERLVRED